MKEPDRPRVTGALVPPAPTAKPWTSEICKLVNDRYHQLGGFQIQLEENAKRLRRTGQQLKGSLIVLGALSATKATADAIMDPGAKQSIAIFAIFGALTTIMAGLSAAFKPEETGGQLAGLAAEVASTRAIILYTWDRILLEHAGTLASVTDDGSEVKLIEELLERLNVKTGDIYTRAAALGVQPPKGPKRLRELNQQDGQQLNALETLRPQVESPRAS